MGLGTIPLVVPPLILFCGNSRVMTPSKESRNHRKNKYIEMKYYLILKTIMRRDVVVEKITYVENLADLFTKTLSTKVFYGYRNNIGVKCIPNKL